VPKVYISSSSHDGPVARRLAAELEQQGFDVRDASTSIMPGDVWLKEVEAAIRSADVVLVLVSEASPGSRVGREVAIAIRHADQGKLLLIPVVLDEVPDKLLPYGLQTRQGLRLDTDSQQSYRHLAAAVQNSYGRRDRVLSLPPMAVSKARRATGFGPAGPSRGAKPDTWMSPEEHRDAVRVVADAFAAAGRPLHPTERPELLEPGPVWVAPEVSPTGRDLDRFARFLRSGRIGYLVHVGDLSRDAQIALDQMRLGGTPVVTVTVRALRSALADRRVEFFFSELERDYGTIDNLFDTRNALIDERFLFGRDVMLNTVGSAIQRREHVLLTGLRKVGKTSLLNILRQRLVTQPVCHVDLQRFDRHQEDWPPTLYRLILKSLDNWALTEDDGWPFRPSAPRTATELEEALDARAQHLGRDTTLVVIADELERVFPAPGEQAATRRWIQATGTLRALSQGARCRVVVLGADLRPTANRDNDLGSAGTNPFFSLFQEMPVPLLDSTAVADMIESLGRAMGIDVVTIEFLDRLFTLTGGHPSLARTIAGQAYRTRSADDRLDGADLARAVEHLDDTDAIAFFLRANLWQLMTTPEQEVLTALAKRPWQGRLRRQSERHQMAHATLTAQGLVDRTGIRIELFRTWLRERGDP
jgi:TIR domain